MKGLQEFVDTFTYLGIFTVLLLGSLGVPIPEELPIIGAGVLSHVGVIRWWLALPVCLLGVLSGDMVLYWVGRHWGEMFGLAYFFTDQIQGIMADVHRAERWLALAGLLALAAMLGIGVWRWHRRVVTEDGEPAKGRTRPS